MTYYVYTLSIHMLQVIRPLFHTHSVTKVYFTSAEIFFTPHKSKQINMRIIVRRHSQCIERFKRQLWPESNLN